MRARSRKALAPGTRLQRNPDFVRSIVTPDAIHAPGRAETAVRLSSDAFEVLDGFETPRAIRDVVPDADDDVLGALADWVERGLLVVTSRPRRPSRTAPAEVRLWADTARTISRRIARLKPSRRERVRGHDLVVLDGLFTPSEVRSAARFFSTCAYHKSESVKDMKDYTHEAHELLARVPFVESITRIVERAFPRLQLSLYRAYCNRLRFGDVSFEHADSRTPSLTALYYANARWNDDWGGETLFYGVLDEPTVAVAPRPGRLVVFDGQLGHRGGVPSRVCHEGRLSVAVKYWVKERSASR